MLKKCTSLLLIFAMLITVLPIQSFAEKDATPDNKIVEDNGNVKDCEDGKEPDGAETLEETEKGTETSKETEGKDDEKKEELTEQAEEIDSEKKDEEKKEKDEVEDITIKSKKIEYLADGNGTNIIENKEELLAFLTKEEKKVDENSIVGGEYVIKGKIEIDSSELPEKPLNVYGSKITGENAEIIITNDGKAPRGIFGTIQNNEVGSNQVTEVGFSYISDIKFTFNGDVEKYTFAENLQGKVFKGLEKSSTINNIDIKVNGNIIPDRTEKWINISGFVIDCYGFDLNGIKIHVTGNIGVDEYIGSLVGAQGLFTDSKSNMPPTRLNNSSVKVDGKMIAKSQWALAGGLTVNDNPVIANNVSSDIGSMKVESIGSTNNYNYSGASVGFLNNHGKNILLDSGYANVNITVNPWVENDIGIEFRSGFSRSNNETPEDIGSMFKSPMEGIKDRAEVDFPRVDNGKFKTGSITVDSKANARVAGAAYYMAGTNNTVDIKSINASGMNDSVIAGYGGYNNDGENIEVHIGDINFNQEGSGTTFGVFGSTVNDYGTVNSSVNIGNITGTNTASSPSYSYVGGWSNTSTLGNNNSIKLGDISVDGVGNNDIAGYTRNIKKNKTISPKIEKCNVVLGNIAAKNGNGMNKFTGFVKTAPETSGEINNCKVFTKNIALTGGTKTQPMLSFSGFTEDNKGTITKSSTIIDGDVKLDRGLWITTFGGFVTKNTGTITDSSVQILGNIMLNDLLNHNYEDKDFLQIAGFVGETKGTLNNNTVLLFGSIENLKPEQLNRIQESLGLFAAYSEGTEFKNNAVYIGDSGNISNSVFKDADIVYINNMSQENVVSDNTILLDKDTYIKIDKFVPVANSNVNHYIEVDKGNRTAYPYENNKLKKLQEDIIGNIEIAGRSFQDDYWKVDLAKDQNYSNFKYVLKNENNIKLNNYGPDIKISNDPFTIGNLENTYDRHMAISNNGVTYDIFGIKGGEETFTITYKGNGNTSGTAPIDEKEYKLNEEVKVLDKGNLVKSGYTFIGWNTKADGSGISYKSKDVFNIKENTTLYAQWVRNYVPTEPEIQEPSEPVDPDPVPELNKKDHYAYMVGESDKNFRPNDNITRAEVVTIFFRMLTENARNQYWSTVNNFKDVNEKAWYNNAVSTMANAKVISADENGNYRPNEAMTRGEFAVLLSKFFNETGTKTHNFTDIKGHFAEDEIAKVAAKGWIEGYADKTFRPDEKITRAEAVKLVNRILERTPDIKNLLPNMIEFKDNQDVDKWYYVEIQEAANSHEYTRSDSKSTETWTKLLPVRDWVALEKEWSKANSSTNPGNVK